MVKQDMVTKARNFLLLVALATASAVAWAQVEAATATVTIKWVAPTLHTDGTPITAPLTYKVWMGAKGAVKTSSTSVSTGLQTQLTAPVGSCFEVSAVESGAGESAHTPEVCMKAVPNAPSGTVLVSVTIS